MAAHLDGGGSVLADLLFGAAFVSEEGDEQLEGELCRYRVDRVVVAPDAQLREEADLLEVELRHGRPPQVGALRGERVLY